MTFPRCRDCGISIRARATFCRGCIRAHGRIRLKRRLMRMTVAEYEAYRAAHQAYYRTWYEPRIRVKKCAMLDCTNTFEITGTRFHAQKWCDVCRPLGRHITMLDASRRYRERQRILRTLGTEAA